MRTLQRAAVVYAAVAAVGAVVCAVEPASAGGPPTYGLVGRYTLGGNGSFDVLADGRVITLGGASGRDVLVQEFVNGSGFVRVGSIDASLAGPFGPGFLRLSPDGSRVAIGDNVFGAGARVNVLRVSSLFGEEARAEVSVLSPNFDAAWSGSDTLLVTGATASFQSVLTRVDLGAAPGAATVITGIGLGSGGVAVRDGRVFVGSGFDLPPSQTPTGQVRAFDLGAISSGGVPQAFTAGAIVTTQLSASPLDFDALGNLLVGGGDAFSGTSEVGFVAVVDLSDPSRVQRLSPAGTGVTYGVRFNRATGEVLVIEGGTVFRYAVPAPGGVAVLALAGVLASRRRRGPGVGLGGVVGGGAK